MSSNYSNNAELYGHEDGICDNCGEEVSEDFVLTNSYGDQLCENCWDEYINSEEGLVEYVIGLANTDYDITDFDENDLVNMAMSWNSHKSELALAPADILKIEADATAMGLNFHPTDPDGVELTEAAGGYKQDLSYLVDLLKDAAANKKPASFIKDILAADGLDETSVFTNYGKIYKGIMRDFVDNPRRKVTDFATVGDSVVATLCDLIRFERGIMKFSVKLQDGSQDDFYIGVLPSAESNYKAIRQEIIVVNEQHNTLEVPTVVDPDKTYDLLEKTITSTLKFRVSEYQKLHGELPSKQELCNTLILGIY